MERRTVSTDLALIAGFAALIAATTLFPDIKTGFGVPFSLQTFGVLLAGACLGPWRGFCAAALYLVGGGIGLPIFSGGAAGWGHFAGPTGGYLVGFAFAAGLCGFLVQRAGQRRTQFAVVFTAGLLSSFVFIHTLGVLNLAWRADLPLSEAAGIDAVFFPGDILKNIVMALVATAVHRAFPNLLATRSQRPRARREDDTTDQSGATATAQQ